MRSGLFLLKHDSYGSLNSLQLSIFQMSVHVILDLKYKNGWTVKCRIFCELKLQHISTTKGKNKQGQKLSIIQGCHKVSQFYSKKVTLYEL
jgi:hypothetical protein